MEVRLIRHFATEGNLEKRYIGVTDEEIKTECVPEYTLKKEENGRYGKENGRAKWEPELVIVSPLRRCRQTAEILFPGVEQVVCDKMRKRCVCGFEEMMEKMIKGKRKKIAFVVHGGTIMSVMEAFDPEKKEFYHWQVKNGKGFHFQIEEEKWQQGNRQFEEIEEI